MNAIILLVTHEISSAPGYIIGAAISLFIFGYLIYSLIKPDKF
ncbi:MAG: K(+)-transporting ATPase subunit F [Bacteroidales bacterium]|jgi:K+-transporting ATPase KdpF subunit|nr:K(+)-transporting ATPase subunit F [Bacteroidales bacterium]